MIVIDAHPTVDRIEAPSWRTSGLARSQAGDLFRIVGLLVADFVIFDTLFAMNRDSSIVHEHAKEAWTPESGVLGPIVQFVWRPRSSASTLCTMKRSIVQLFLSLSLFTAGCDGPAPGLPDSLGGVQWAQGAPRFSDFNGDGVLDPFGWVHEWNGHLNPRIAGYDGANGQRLWITPVLGALGESHHARIGLIGGTLIVADSGGTARAFRPGEDAAVWSVALGERADGLCSAGPGKVVVRTADDRAQVLDLTTGAAQPAAPPQSCTLDEYAQAAFRPDRTHGMKEIDFAVVRARSQEERRIWELAPDLAEGEVLEVSPELQVLLGDKREGTSVPMVASLHGGRLAWSTVVPAEDPLRARSLTMPRATADTHAVFVGYERGDENRIAAFAMVDGRRLWDVEIPQMREDSNNIDAIGLTPDLLYVAHFTYLSALDRETGKERYTIGQRR